MTVEGGGNVAPAASNQTASYANRRFSRSFPKPVSPADKKVKGWNHKEWGNEVPVDVSLDSAKADEFDPLLLPGGVMNPDQLRMNPKAVEFVKHFTDSGKPVAAICRGPWTLVEAGAVGGHTMTSWPSLKTDLKECGRDLGRPGSCE
jgi:protease I